MTHKLLNQLVHNIEYQVVLWYYIPQYETKIGIVNVVVGFEAPDVSCKRD